MKKMRKMIGVCGSRIFEENNMLFINELQRLGVENGYLTIAFSSNVDELEDTDEVLGERYLFELAKYIDLSAIILLAESIKNKTLIHRIVNIAREKNIPVFCMDRQIEGCYYLYRDIRSGFEQLVRHVVEDHGAKHVNMLAGFRHNNFSDERVEIYKKVLAENQIPFEEERLGYGEFWDRPAKKELLRFLKSDLPMPDAIICANDAMAIVACAVLKEHGYRVPDDVIVTGFDGIQSGRYYHPVLSTCEPDFYNTASYIFQELHKIEETGKFDPKEIVTKFIVDRNQSCGCQPDDDYDRNAVITKLCADLGDCAWHTIAMNQMVTSVLSKQTVREIAQILPDSEKMWSDHFRFACVKSEILDSCHISENFGEMGTILRGDHEVFEKPGESFFVEDFIPRLDTLLDETSETNILVVTLLNAGSDVYGYAVEGFDILDERNLQRSNEFSMFLANSINTVLHNQQLYELNEHLLEANREIAVLSEQDALTGLYNRRGFYVRFREMLQQTSKRYLALLSIDMNRLKYINDTFGHAEGDFAIKTLAHAVAEFCGEETVCARFGGDEFDCAVFLDDLSEIQEQEVWSALQEYIDQTEGVSEKPYPITASIGIYGREISEDLEIEQMIREADRLMYANKKDRRRV